MVLAMGTLGLTGACDRHEWKDTKSLHEPHGNGHHEEDSHPSDATPHDTSGRTPLLDEP
ncbi:hypothetical protein BH23VER1_BH23VER1_05960 [soil metagenome]